MSPYIKIAAPFCVVLLVEFLFQLGVWEPITFPLSHVGTSIRLKRALTKPELKLDFVTLGSSRPEYGLDHEEIAKAALENGYLHANLSMPGSHWMTVRVLSTWLSEHHSELRGGFIALSTQDFNYLGNGHYELAFVHPF